MPEARAKRTVTRDLGKWQVHGWAEPYKKGTSAPNRYLLSKKSASKGGGEGFKKSQQKTDFFILTASLIHPQFGFKQDTNTLIFLLVPVSKVSINPIMRALPKQKLCFMPLFVFQLTKKSDFSQISMKNHPILFWRLRMA